MSDSSRSKPKPAASGGGRGAKRSGNPAKAATPERHHHPIGEEESGGNRWARTAIAATIAVLGIVWLAVYINVAQDGEQLTWMGELGRWNFMIGFGLLFIGLALLAHPSTPLGRGRGVVVGMLGSFLIGLVWIIVYYLAGQPTTIPVVRNLDAYNLIVGIGFMAVGFVYATHWE